MNLYKQTIEYQTLEFLEGCINLSKTHFTNPDRTSLNALDNMVTMSLGRRTGHTTAIREYILENNAKQHNKENIILVTPTYSVGKMLYGDFKIKFHVPRSNTMLGGSRVQTSLIGIRNVGIIFDTCSNRDILNFMEAVAPFHNNITYVVNIAPTHII